MTKPLFARSRVGNVTTPFINADSSVRQTMSAARSLYCHAWFCGLAPISARSLTKDTRAFIIRESRPRMPPSLALLCMTRSFSEICEVKHFSSGRHCSRNNQSIYRSHGGGNDCPSSILFWCRAAIPPPTRKGCFVKGAPSLVTRKNVSSSDPNRGRLRPLSFPSPSRFSFTSRTLNCLLPSARATACKLRDGGRGGVEDLGSFPLQSQSERRHPSRAGICDRE